MPRIQYIQKGFHSKSTDLIGLCNRIIRNYQAQGFALTLRQLYYRLVAGGYIANRQREYKRLGSIINDARLAGLVDWYAIEDRTRSLRDKSRWESPTEIMQAVAKQFIIDRWANQPWRVEVWVEKDALIGVVGRAAGNLDVPYFSCRGYTSQSEMWRASRRVLRHLDGGQHALIIHLADHDPSGIDMTRDIQNRFDVFWAGQAKVERLALNKDQVDQYQPPPNPAKVTDSRYNAYVMDFGGDSWELDALEPQVIVDLITDLIKAHRDEDKWTEALELEAEMQDVLDQALGFIEDQDIWAKD